ncbi:hypothetical protein D0863_14860 [Hortaea werneckii]|uniref:Uncharacterized protein n=1 Tax=Hortaea werneckii TaxID=91943 RepID=A0A3M7CEB8_HORWE|nr:hypothetical protein D0863_14860 [Hortaea werneckii]
MPGAGKQPPEVQLQIKELLEAGFDPTTIHRRLKVGRSSIYRMKRCLATHGTAYTPEEHNKKNGRPKVLTAEQELEVRNWLRDPKNRGRYLDDLVWLIHERYGVVCSTTTMSKMRRKWLKVVECEESGAVLDDETRKAVWETHPNLEVLQRVGPDGGAPMVPMMTGPISNALEGDPHENGGGGGKDENEASYSAHALQQQQQQEPVPAMEQPFQDHFHPATEHQHPYAQNHPGFPQQEPNTDHMTNESNHYPLPPPIHHPYPSDPAPPPPPTEETHQSITTSAAEDPQQQQQPLTDPQLQHIGPPPPPQLDPQIDPRFQELQNQALDAHLQQQLQQEMAGHDERQRQQQQQQQEQEQQQQDAVQMYGEA